jgi:hypothetical protein
MSRLRAPHSGTRSFHHALAPRTAPSAAHRWSTRLHLSGVPLAWDGKDERTGSLVSAGIYFFRLEVGSHRQEGKVAVVR